MSLTSLADLLSRQFSHARVADERSEMRWEIEQARLAQVQRHHEERLAAEQQRSVIQAQAAERNAKAKDESTLAQLARKHVLETAAKSSALIDNAW